FGAYAYPIIGKIEVRAISAEHVLQVLMQPLVDDDPRHDVRGEPRPTGAKAPATLWHRRPETASRLLGRIANVLGAATTRGWRSGPNPAAWADNIEHFLPKKTKVRPVEHHKAVPWQDAPVIITELAQQSNTAAKALLFLVHTATRSGEVRGATWHEMEGDVWVI